MDKIIIRDLLARCIVGINEDERREKQDVVITLVLFADLAQAGRSDDIRETIDYKVLKKKILEVVENSRYYLVEALAEAVRGLPRSSARQESESQVEKPGALRFAKSVGVEIVREKAD